MHTRPAAAYRYIELLMNDLVVYTTAYRACKLLRMQVATLRKYAQGLSRIVVVTGPLLPTNPIALLEEQCQTLGVETYELPRQFGHYANTQRVMAMYEHIWSLPRSPAERYVVAMHGDLFPYKPFSGAELMRNAVTAGRGDDHVGGGRLLWTWVGHDFKDKLPPRLTQTRQVVPGSFIWPAYAATREQLSNVFGDRCPPNYSAQDHFEICEPCFLHSDKITKPDPPLMEKKLGMLEHIFQLERGDDPCVAIAGVAPAPKPKAFGPADGKFRSKRRGKKRKQKNSDAGCCGDGKKAIFNYVEALNRWIKAGRPIRTDEEVQEIYSKFCGVCAQRDPTTQKCKLCGCYVRPDEVGLFQLLKMVGASATVNKIRMGTEHCPRKLW